MANDPTDVGCGPEHVAGMAAINIFHRPLQRDRMAAVVDAYGKLARSKAAEHHGVDRPDACTGKHCHYRFGNHRHINDDAVAFANAQLCQHARKSGGGVAQFAVRKRFDLIADGAVVNERGLVGAAGFDVPVERVEAGVELAAGEPAVEGGAGIVEDLVPLLVPVDGRASLAPERFGVVNRTIECGLPRAAGPGCGHHSCAPITRSYEDPEFAVTE